MRMRGSWIAMVCGLLLSAEARCSVPDCYPTPAEAASHAGVRGIEGFRIEAQQRDIFSGDLWVSIRSCGHPERPAWLMPQTEASPGSGHAGTRPREMRVERPMVLHGGTMVRLLETGPTMRIETSVMAESSGAVGDRVRVRRIPVSAAPLQESTSSWERPSESILAIVRSRDLVEVATR